MKTIETIKIDPKTLKIRDIVILESNLKNKSTIHKNKKRYDRNYSKKQTYNIIKGELL